MPTTLNVSTTASVTPIWYIGTNTVTIGSSYTPSTATPTTTVYTISDSSTVTGCTNLTAGNTLTVSVTINQAPAPPTLTGTLTSPFSECQGATPTTLNVSTTASVTPIWYIGTNTVAVGSSYTPSTATPTTTVYTISDSSTVTGCTNLTAGNTLTISVMVIPAPSVNVSGVSLDSAKCGLATGGVSGIAIVGGAPTYTYQWYDSNGAIPGATSISLSNVATGNYSLQVTDANGCMANGTGGVTTFSVPASTAVHAQFSTNPSPTLGTVPLAITFSNTSNGASNYIWSFGDAANTYTTSTNANFTYTSAGTFTATLIAINGACADTAYIVIIAKIPTTIIIPNIFSPNGDGTNDEFFINNTGMQSLNCDIFNRWGQLLYTLTAPNQSWDGKLVNGDKAPEGTYMYILEAHGLDNKVYKQQGTLTLVR
jgi:gliding motility-associated-like protein